MKSGAARLALVALACLPALFPRMAAADPTSDLCLADSLEGQVLRSHGRLTRATEHLEQCARPECEAAMRVRCAQWLVEVRAAIPVIAVHVVDDRRAAIDGAVVRLDGSLIDATQELPVDPGRHELRADYGGRRGLVAFDTTPGRQEVVAIVDLQATAYARPIPTPAFVSAGVSLAGFLGFAAFGVATLVQQGSLAQCAPYCDASQRTPLQTTEVGADIGLGVGVVGFVAATVFYFARPTVPRAVRVDGRGVTWDF